MKSQSHTRKLLVYCSLTLASSLSFSVLAQNRSSKVSRAKSSLSKAEGPVSVRSAQTSSNQLAFFSALGVSNFNGAHGGLYSFRLEKGIKPRLSLLGELNYLDFFRISGMTSGAYELGGAAKFELPQLEAFMPYLIGGLSYYTMFAKAKGTSGNSESFLSLNGGVGGQVKITQQLSMTTEAQLRRTVDFGHLDVVVGIHKRF